MNNPFLLTGKTILVTGASSGIGRATAIECSKLGAKVIMTGRNEQRLQETFQQLATEGGQYFVAELTDEKSVEELVEKMPAVDGLVNAAGIASTILFQYAKPEKIRSMFDVNFFAPIELTRLLLKKKNHENNSCVYSLKASFFGTLHLSGGRDCP